MAQCARGQRGWLRHHATVFRGVGVPPGPENLGNTAMVALSRPNTFERKPIEEN